MTGLRSELRRCFLAGLLALVPLVVTVTLLRFVVSLMDGLLDQLPHRLHPDSYLPWHIPGLGVVLAVSLTIVVGAATRHYVGSRLLVLWEALLRHIPLVRGIYGASKQLLEAIFVSGSDSFKRAVLVEYPRRGVWAIGLVTGPARGELADLALARGQRLLNVYLPHTPNPTAGVYVAIPEEQALPLEMTVEEALKVVISGGIVTPPRAARAEEQVPARLAPPEGSGSRDMFS